MSKALVKRSTALPAKVAKDRVVQQLRTAEQALAQAVTVSHFKLVVDVAAAQQVLATRQKLGEDVISYAHRIKMHALAGLGDLLKQMPKATGGTHGGRHSKLGAKREPSSTAPPTYADLGLDKKTAHIAQRLADLDPRTREAIASREITIAQARRETTAAAIRKKVSLPDAKYRVVYADPPWSYADKADAGAVQAGGAEKHYPSMTIEQLCALEIVKMVEDHAVLFLWVTGPLLFECAPVIKAWGFTYRAAFVWDKVKHNMGHYNSVRHEFLLICTRGSCTPDVTKRYDSVQSIEKTGHSVKPPEFRDIIDTLYPHGKRIELFARGTLPTKWDAWGYEAG